MQKKRKELGLKNANKILRPKKLLNTNLEMSMSKFEMIFDRIFIQFKNQLLSQTQRFITLKHFLIYVCEIKFEKNIIKISDFAMKFYFVFHFRFTFGLFILVRTGFINILNFPHIFSVIFLFFLLIFHILS